MHKAEPQHTGIRIAAHRPDRPHGVEIPLAGHDAMLGKRDRDLLSRLCRMQRDGGHASGLGAEFLAAENTGVVAAAEIVQQWRKHPVLMPALQCGNGPRPVRRSGLSAMMMRIDSIDIVRHAGAGRDLGMVGTGRCKPLVADIGIEKMRLVDQPVGKRAPDHHDPLMRAIGLVAGEQVDIRSERADIGQPVRRIADTVTAGDRADVMRHGSDPRDRILLPDDVGAMRETDQLYLVVENGGKAVQFELAALRIDAPFADFHPAIFKPPPRTAVRLMILICDNHRVAGRQGVGKGLRQDIGVLACRRAEAELVGLDIHQRCQPCARIIHLGTAGRARRIAAIGLDLALCIEAMEPVDNLTAGVRPARILKKSLPLKRGFGEGREL